MYEKKQQNTSKRNTVTSISMKIFGLNFDTIISKPIAKLCQNFKSVFFELVEEQSVKIRYGRAGPVHRSYRLQGKNNVL